MLNYAVGALDLLDGEQRGQMPETQTRPPSGPRRPPWFDRGVRTDHVRFRTVSAVLFALAGAVGVMLAVAVLVILVRAGRDGSSIVPDRFSTVFLPFAVTATACLATAIAIAPDRRSRATAVVLLMVTVCVSGLATAWIARSAADDCLTLAPPTGARLNHLAGISLSPTGRVTCRWDSATGGAPVERTSYRFFDTAPGVSS